MLHAFQLLFTDCNYPKAFVWWIGMHAVMFFFLFKEFYNQSYSGKRVNSEISLKYSKHFSKSFSLRLPSLKFKISFSIPIQQSIKHFAICFLQRTDHSSSNGSVKKNDDADKNGHANGVINSNKASDYYIKSEELTSNLTQRHVAKEQ